MKSIIVVLAVSTAAVISVSSASAQRGGGNLPTCKQFCDSIGAGGPGDFRSCANNNNGKRCKTLTGGPIKDKRPGSSGR